ncbi:MULTISPECIES: DUF6098 family protein [Streptomyces]|uniref:DUF6098 family protein n=1 Tax=Streptomyces lateritius TaxID=67313 RepID=A0ABW6Y8J4_9ACTN|nr:MULTISPECIES: DUF6098 family protein [Streptomyces]QGZ52087.1 hypothetical protein GPZ77_30300 [Streptomyces sp. QHH-9511]GGT73124.1 hypothetical protein GCM10010272_15550 [Streptomyces lateritius]
MNTPDDLRTLQDMPVIGSLDELAGLLAARGGLYLRWSRGPGFDLAEHTSRDGLTGIELPGLSANPLDAEPWWEDRSLRVWAARRLHDYSHLPRIRGPGVRPWLLRGTEAGRGPDNEPLVRDVAPLGWVADAVIKEAESVVAGQNGEWGPMSREASPEETRRRGT